MPVLKPQLQMKKLFLQFEPAGLYWIYTARFWKFW